ncbi:MAG: response regulator [Candidatus Omnitrophota bacterium]|nr:response regulator [Candidatus Omnitrophota bacterium]
MSDVKSVPKMILVIDDEGDLLKLARARLEASGYTILTLDSGDHAVEVAKSEKPDLVLLDIVMPGKNGCEVCKELKADKATGSIPVIVFTAQYPEEEYVKTNMEEIGADDYVLKPFDAQALLAKIKFLIK